MYKRMAEEARKEGFDDIAAQFEGVAAIEKNHEQRYRDLLKDVKEGSVFKRSSEIIWQCQNCGHQHKGKTPPTLCPVCSHPRSYFQELPKKNY
jgi:rubrerythrin